jgi:nitroreductase
MSHPANPSSSRSADAPILPLFIDRWSPRAMTGEAVPREALMTILEAARWAPSSHNVQPWRFLYALRDDAHWQDFLSLPNERNRSWCSRAGALLVLVADTAPKTHAFDTGCAWGYMALQASALGWSAHAMAGFDAQRARQLLNIPEAFAVQAMVAIGRQGVPDVLSDELRGREFPSPRRPVADSAMAGRFVVREEG